jgi:hypothetical protein
MFDFGDDSQSYGYGGGGGACAQINFALDRDGGRGAADHEDDETWAPSLPNITAVAQQLRVAQGGPVRVPPLGRDAPRDPRTLPSWVMGWESSLPVFSE